MSIAAGNACAPRLLFLVTEDWYFISHRLGLARRAREAGFEVIVGTRFNADRALLAAEGFTLCDIPFERSLRHPCADWRAWRAIRAVLARERPDVIHLVSLKPILLGGLAARALPGSAVLMAFTGLGYIFSSGDALARAMRPWIVSALRRLAARAQCWLLLQNDDDRALLGARGIGVAARTCVIPGSGVDIEQFAESPLPPVSRPLVLLPARLLRDKGVHEFVEAARLVRAARPQVRFVLAGARDDDNPAVVPAAVLERWQRDGLVEWWGHRTDMADVYAQASIVCLPSYREGLPKALLEAAACARPLIATDVPGCREICRHEQTGLVVPAGNAEALAQAIVRLLDDPALATRLGSAARARVMREYTLDAIASATLALYARMRDDVTHAMSH